MTKLKTLINFAELEGHTKKDVPCMEIPFLNKANLKQEAIKWINGCSRHNPLSTTILCTCLVNDSVKLVEDL